MRLDKNQQAFFALVKAGLWEKDVRLLPFGNIDFKIWLMNGGCGTFAPAYLKMVASCKRNRGRGAEQSVINSIKIQVEKEQQELIQMILL